MRNASGPRPRRKSAAMRLNSAGQTGSYGVICGKNFYKSFFDLIETGRFTSPARLLKANRVKILEILGFWVSKSNQIP